MAHRSKYIKQHCKISRKKNRRKSVLRKFGVGNEISDTILKANPSKKNSMKLDCLKIKNCSR